MSCRAFSSHRGHASVRLGDGASIEHGSRCCCVKQDVPCDTAGNDRGRAMPTPQYCRCGALRAPSFDHLFIPEDLSLVPAHLKYSKDRFRGVQVDGRTYFLPNRDQAVRKDPVTPGREPTERQDSDSYATPSGPPMKDMFKDRHRLPTRSAQDDWRSEKRRSSLGRANEERRPPRTRQTTNDRGSFVLTVNTGNRYQPPNLRERRFTIPRLGGSAYCSSHSRDSARPAGVSSTTGSACSAGNRESAVEGEARPEKRRERRPRIVKFADDEHLLASIEEEPDSERRSSSESRSRNRVRKDSAGSEDRSVTRGKENGRRRNGSRKGKYGEQKMSETQSSAEEMKILGNSEGNKEMVVDEVKSKPTTEVVLIKEACAVSESLAHAEPTSGTALTSDQASGSGDIACETKCSRVQVTSTTKPPSFESLKIKETIEGKPVTSDQTFLPGSSVTVPFKNVVIPSLGDMAQEALTKLVDGGSEDKRQDSGTCVKETGCA